MIVVRDIFQLHFGKARDAIALAREMRATAMAGGFDRILTDLTGQYYTLVFESEFESLAAFEQSLRKELSDPSFKELYSRLVPLVHEGRREVFQLVD
jgi:hypothetical protein